MGGDWGGDWGEIAFSFGRCSSSHALSFGSHLFFLRRKSFSDMLTRKMPGFAVSRLYSLSRSISLTVHSPKRISFSASESHLRIFCVISRRSFFSFALPSRATSFLSGSISFSMAAMSFFRSSSPMIVRSRIGSTSPSTCDAASPSIVSSKTRTTLKMASVALMCERKALPKPSPSAAPLTRPAMSTTERKAGTSDFGWNFSSRCLKLGSDSSTRASVGSIVQKGKFSAGTDMLHMMLNVVDLPTFGIPTTPARTLLPGRPSGSFSTGAAVEEKEMSECGCVVYGASPSHTLSLSALLRALLVLAGCVGSSSPAFFGGMALHEKKAERGGVCLPLE